MELSQRLLAWLGPTDPLQRRAKVGAWLNQLGDPKPGLLEEWLGQTRQGNGHAQEALLSCCDPRWWFAQLGEDGIAAWRQQALAEHQALANLWLTACSPSQWDGEQVVEATLIHPTLRQMTLGARRSLARHAPLDTLPALILDPDPVVLSHALQHPKMTETIVLQGCAQRSTSATHLWTFIDHWRWFTRAEIRFALASNRAVPVGLAICLLFTFPNMLLRQLQTDGLLSPTLQRAVLLLLAYP